MPAPTAPVSPIEVDAPALERYPFGLLSAASVQTVADTHWELHGVTYWTHGCTLTGGIWIDGCIVPPITEVEVQAYLVTLTKAIGVDVVVATLTARDAHYGTNPVFITVDGVTKSLATVGATQSYDVTASTTVPVIGGIGANGGSPQCDVVDSFDVPATGTSGTDTVSCMADVPAPEVLKDTTHGLTVVQESPFTVYDGLTCTSQGLSEAGGAAEQQFAAREQYWVENRFTEVVLHTDTTALNGGTAMPMLRGIGLLEERIAELYGGVGTLHAARELAATFNHFGLTRRDGARMRSPLDNVWALGAGYSTAGPTGTAAPANQAWVYATGPVVIRRGPIELRESFDQRKNTALAIAERNYAITADCLRLAVLVQLPEV